MKSVAHASPVDKVALMRRIAFRHQPDSTSSGAVIR